MKVIELTQKDSHRYNEFVKNHPLGSIHQTWEWGEFQIKTPGRDRFWVFAVEDEKGQILASALVIRQTLPFKKCWLYSPRGPLVRHSDAAPDGNSPIDPALQKLLEKIEEFARSQNAVFFRFDPPLEKNGPQKTEQRSAFSESESAASFRQFHARPAHAHYQPQNTLILGLSSTREDMLAQMKPKGRYNIKVAQKHEVTVRQSRNSPADIDAFYSLLRQTAGRDAFSGHAKKYYEDMLKTLVPPPAAAHSPGSSASPYAELYLAEYRPSSDAPPQIIAGIIVTCFKDTATYYFGASGNEHRNVMAPYLLQWKAICDAKAAGMEYYDFLGISPEENPAARPSSKSHPWAGVTDFKLKFGGRRVNYVPAMEIVYRPLWFALIKLIKKIRR